MKEGLEIINVFKDDVPEDVARKFVSKYPEIMSEQAVEILAMQINQKLREINKDAKQIGETEENQPQSEKTDDTPEKD